MKFVAGVIRGRTLERLSQALGRAGVYRPTVSEVEILEPESAAPPSEDARRLELEIAVNESFLQPTLGRVRVGA